MARSPGRQDSGALDRLRAEMADHVEKRLDALRTEVAEMLANLGSKMGGAPSGALPTSVVTYDQRVHVRTETVLDVPPEYAEARAAMVIPHGPGRLSVRATELRDGRVRFILDGSGHADGVSVLFLVGVAS